MASDFVEALQQESLQRFPGKGRKAKLARKAWRNEQRAAQGLKPESKLSRGGVAGVWDRNKKVIKPIALGAASLLTGGIAAPALLGAAMGGLDREGKSGVGFDVGGGLRGAAEGALAGKLAQIGNAGVQGFRGAQGVGMNPLVGAAKGVQLGARDAIASQFGNQNVGVMPVAQQGGQMATMNTGGGWFNTAKNWLSDPNNLLAVGQAAYGASQSQQQLDAQRRATAQQQQQWNAGQPLRNAAMNQLSQSYDPLTQFNQFAEQTQPAYEASLRDANRYGAAQGQLGSGMLRTSFGDLANQRGLQLDAARNQYLNEGFDRGATMYSLGNQNNPYNAQQDLGNLYGQRAQTAFDSIGRFGQQKGYGVIPPTTPPFNPNARNGR